jgi:hypothetical protein
LLLICSELLCPPIRNLPMSSAPSVTDLRPDLLWRSLLLALVSLMHLAGMMLLLLLPLPTGVLALLAFGWARMCVHDWRNQLRAYGRVAAIRVQATGHIESIGPYGNAEPVRLLGGSFVLPRVAWLRLEFADCSRYGELLVGDRCLDSAWHWLQLNWRQHGARFGQPDRS